jgi:hypothetical protein
MRVFIIVFCLLSVAGLGLAEELTCVECKKVEEELNSIDKERAALDDQYIENYKKGDFVKAREARTKVDAMNKKVLDLEKKIKDGGCAESCKPDKAKQQECQQLSREIQTMEGEESKVENMLILNKKYKELTRCVRELQKLKQTKQK